MSKKKHNQPTQAELEVLRILWDFGPATVRDVHEKISPSGETGYTTTLKTMQNMHEKGFLEREPSGRSHIYKSSLKEEDLQQTLLGGFLKIAFGGSAKKLVLQALGNHKTTNEEISEIRKLLDEIEKDQKK